MCCANASAAEAFVPTGTWLDLTTKNSFTPEEVAEQEGCSPRTIQRAVDAGEFGPLPYPVGRSLKIPRLAVMHFHDGSRRRRQGRDSTDARS